MALFLNTPAEAPAAPALPNFSMNEVVDLLREMQKDFFDKPVEEFITESMMVDMAISSVKAIWEAVVKVCGMILTVIKRIIFAFKDMLSGNQRMKVQKSISDFWVNASSACDGLIREVGNDSYTTKRAWEPVETKISNEINAASRISTRPDEDTIPASMIKSVLHRIDGQVQQLEGIAKAHNSKSDSIHGKGTVSAEERETAHVRSRQAKSAHLMIALLSRVTKSIINHLPGGKR
jgi:phage-related protein